MSSSANERGLCRLLQVAAVMSNMLQVVVVVSNSMSHEESEERGDGKGAGGREGGEGGREGREGGSVWARTCRVHISAASSQDGIGVCTMRIPSNTSCC